MQKGHFLNDEQKAIKQEIMEGLMASLFGTLSDNIDKFDEQSASDIVFSCLMMFSREVLMRLIVGSGSLDNVEPVLLQFQVGIALYMEEEIRRFTDNKGGTH